jgi:hypothetical protein
MAKRKDLDLNEANKKLGDGWAAPALAAVTALGYGFVTDDILGATIFGGGTGIAARLMIKNRLGHETKGKAREWWVRIR